MPNLPEKMKALVLVGKNEPLAFKNMPTPQLSPDTHIVVLRAAALNHRDVWIQKGLYAGLKYPTILGSDGAGIDLQTGRSVLINPGIGWGDNPHFQSKNYKILGLPDDGTFAEFVAVPAANLHEKPEHLSFEQAAALPLAGLTAWRALFTKCAPQHGERVLITGIGGGVALLACQFAVAAGFEVWVTSSSDEKIARAVAIGARGGFNYRTENWVQKATETLDGGGFNVIVDSAAGDGFTDLLVLAQPGARLSFYGATTLGKLNNLDPRRIFWNQISIHGSTMGNSKEFADMLLFVQDKKIAPIIDAVFDFEDGNAALQKMDEGKQFGKICLKINHS
jgi:zinc-binding alcohol dehydrogenase/oxidoreductase